MSLYLESFKEKVNDTDKEQKKAERYQPIKRDLLAKPEYMRKLIKRETEIFVSSERISYNVSQLSLLISVLTLLGTFAYSCLDQTLTQRMIAGGLVCILVTVVITIIFNVRERLKLENAAYILTAIDEIEQQRTNL